jgi:prevent-host-death family protein
MANPALVDVREPETVTVHQAKTHLSKLLVRVEAGEEIIIARGKKPVGKIVPMESEKPKRRQPGAWKGRIHIGPEFFEPLPDDELRAWGEEVKREPRTPGLLKGKIHLGPEFFEPLPDDELRAWGEIE